MKVNDPKVPLHPPLGGTNGLAGLASEVGSLDRLREEKVTGLRALVATGAYSANVQDVARRFLRELLEELLAGRI